MELTIKNLSKSYGSLWVLKDFSLTLKKGITTLQAPSGSGKTTLLRLIAGLEAPDEGCISLGEGEKGLSYLFQEDRLLPTLTVEENIQLVAPTDVLVPNWLELMGLGDWKNHYPHQLSGGMNRRVALGRALTYPSDILLLDEPFKGLDPDSKEGIVELIKDYGQERITLLITHDEKEALACGGRRLNGTGLPLRLTEETHP